MDIRTETVFENKSDGMVRCGTIHVTDDSWGGRLEDIRQYQFLQRYDAGDSR